MRHSLFILLSLYSLAGKAETYRVELADKTIWQCGGHKSYILTLHCEKDGKMLHISMQGAMGNLEDGKGVRPVKVTSIKTSDGADITNTVMVIPFDDSPPIHEGTRHFSLAILSSSLFPERMAAYMPPGATLTPLSDDYKKFREKFEHLIREDLADIKQVFNDDELIVTSEGMELRCRRSSDLQEKTQQVKEWEAAAGYKYKCGVLKCDDGRYLISGSTPGSPIDLVSFDSQGNWKFAQIQKVLSAKYELSLFAIPPGLTGYGHPVGGMVGGGMGGDKGAPTDLSSQKILTQFFKPQYTAQNFIPAQFRSKQSELFRRQISFPGSTSFLESMTQLCEPDEVKELSASLRAYEERLLNAEMVHYVSDLQNVLRGNYLAPDALPQGGCFDGGVYYREVEAYQKAKSIRAQKIPHAISIAEAQELFKKAQAMDDIAWGYKMDGCYARAHLMARRFEEMGVTVDKAWIKGDLSVKNGDQTINWNFHVTPIVYVRDESGQVKPWAIDPSIMKDAAPVEKWTERMVGHIPGGVVNTVYPFPNNTSMYKKAALAMSNSTPYLPDESYVLSEEAKMSMATSTMREYKGYEK